jgi:hypothetical protein
VSQDNCQVEKLTERVIFACTKNEKRLWTSLWRNMSSTMRMLANAAAAQRARAQKERK